jgi:hypothetical protein
MTSTIPPAEGRPYVTLAADAGETPLDIPAQTIERLYKTHGAILLRGFSLDMDAFRAFTAKYCASSVFNESPDRTVLDAENSIQTVNGGSAPFPLHPELSREPWKPDACFFWCINPPAHGGETTVCDGSAIVKQMPRDVYEAFAARRLVYTLRATPEVCAFWLGTPTPSDEALRNPPPECPYSFTRVGERIMRSFSRPALHKPMFSDNLAFGNFLLFARYHNGRKNFPLFDTGEIVPDALLDQVKAIGDRLAAPIAWQAGDVIMLDNTRFMHGRNAIADSVERRIASYFGYLRFAEPGPEEPANALWRKASFKPPVRPAL